MNQPRREFDDLVECYRREQNRAIALSGETEDYFAEHKVQKLQEWFPELASGAPAILDYGCNDGLMTAIVRRYFPGATVHGIDPSAKSVEYAVRSHPDIYFHMLEGRTLPFPDQSMDLVFAAGVFHHILSAERDIYAKEIFRVLKRGGHFVLFELNPWNPLTVLVFKRCPVDKGLAMIPPGSAKRFFGRYGRTETKFYEFFPRFLRALRPTERYLAKIPLGALYATIVRK